MIDSTWVFPFVPEGSILLYLDELPILSRIAVS
jgi:hypothetical protein